MKNWLTIAEVAAILGLSQDQVRGRIHYGKIPALKAGSTYRIAREVIEQMTGTNAAACDPPPVPEWLTIQQVADRWRISYELVRRQLLSKKIPSLKIGSSYRISIEVVERMETAAKTIEPPEPRRHRPKTYGFVEVDHYPGV